MSVSDHNSLNIFCFKWGDKYGPEYVNRLRNSLKLYCKKDFTFTCITDDPTGIAEDINIEPIYEFELNNSSVFTAVKIELMHSQRTGRNVIIDLDSLIHKDITDLFTRDITKPTFVYTHWTPLWHWKKLVPKKTACFINSSFVRWDGTMGDIFLEHFASKWDYHHSEYNSLDKYLFYEHYMPNHFSSNKDDMPFDFWEEGIFYNYNAEGINQYKFLEDHNVCLFNTSHLIRQDRRYYELDNTPTEHTEIWESYD